MSTTLTTHPWETAIHTAFPHEIPRSATYTDYADIALLLRPFCRPELNHTMLPTGGGMEMIDVAHHPDNDTLELRDEPCFAYVSRPAAVHWEYLPDRPHDSFFLIENGSLRPTGASGEVDPASKFPFEEVVELSPGKYAPRSWWDHSSEGEDDYGHNIPLRKNARLLVRYWSGKFLIVAKYGNWNKNLATYDGRHDRMTAAEIRHDLEKGCRRLVEWR